MRDSEEVFDDGLQINTARVICNAYQAQSSPLSKTGLNKLGLAAVAFWTVTGEGSTLHTTYCVCIYIYTYIYIFLRDFSVPLRALG